MKRLIALLLVIFMVLCTFAACEEKRSRRSSDDEDETEGASNVSETEATDDGQEAPKQTVYEKYGLEEDSLTDYGGYDFRILTHGSTGGEHWSAYEFYYDEKLQGDVLNEAVKERDKDLEEAHNIKVSYVEKNSGSGITDFARDTILAGGDEFDLISGNLSGAATLAQEGMLANLNDYSDILDLDGDHWDQKANEALDIDGHLYFTVNDLTLTDKQAIWVIFASNDLLAKYPELTEGYDDIYDMVRQGDWTIEKMSNMCKAVSKDDGDGVWTNTDVYGHFGEEFSVTSLMIGSGAVGVDKNYAGELEYVLDNNVEDLVTSYKLVDEIVNGDVSMTSNEMSKYAPEDVWVKGLGELLENDRVLFSLRGLNSSSLLRDVDASLGIIPMPKGNEDQDEYYSQLSGMANCVSIPIDAADKERTCEILETMTYIAGQTTYEAYIEKLYNNGHFGDDPDDAEEMIKLIFDSCRYDIGDIYKRGGTTFGAASVISQIPGADLVSSFIQKRQRANSKSLQMFLDDMEEVFEDTSRY